MTKDAPQPLRLDQTSPRYRHLLMLLAECTPRELSRLKLYDLADIQTAIGEAKVETKRRILERKA